MMPQKFGRYEIKRELGRGGMATVFHAYDPRFQRDVALKVLPHEFLHNPNFRLRFEREAHTIAALEHPAIVPVYDFGEEAGQPFLVMRYLPGGSLTQRLTKGALPLEAVNRLISRLAPALDEAHQQGIIHRDLKPDNILFDQRDTPYITDFGIAKLSHSSENLTTGNAIIGTPAYMSPEQAQGETTIDGRSDIYSLGVILFQMLSGVLPFDAPTPVGMVMKHIMEPVPRILDIAPHLPPSIEAVVDKALAKERADRFSTTTQLAQVLDKALRLTQTTSVPVDSAPQVKKTDIATKSHKKSFACPHCQEPLPHNSPLNQRVDCPGCGLDLMITETTVKVMCPQCNAPNSIETQFCTGCGQRLKIDCVQCHSQNPVTAEYCFHCGANLQSAQNRRQELLAARRRAEMEREQAFREKEARQKTEKLAQLIDSLNNRAKQEMAIYQLNQLGQEAITPLIDALQAEDKPNTRYASARTLGQIGSQQNLNPLSRARIVKTLIKVLRDPEPQIRYRAAEALGNFPGQPGQIAVEPLGSLLKDRHEQVRQQARASLQKIGGKRAEEILAKSGGIMGWLKGG